MTPEDHSGGPVRCDQLGPFVDGELLPEEAAAFRKHLVVCARCQQEMHGLMQLSALAEQARVQRPVERLEIAPVVAALDRRARPRRAAWMGVVGAVAIAAAVVLALRGHSSGPGLPAVLASLDSRSVSGWPSAMGPSLYRAYQTSRGTAPPRGSDALARAELRFEATGDLRALATLSLLRRDFDRADGYLAELLQTPDVLADRGLVRLEQSRCADALELLDHALFLQPDNLPARYNRALCLKQLRLPFAAEKALSPVTTARAGGWSEEASAEHDSLDRLRADTKRQDEAIRSEVEALMRSQTPLSGSFIASRPSTARSAYYHAVASAPDRASLERLRPTAQSLDRAVGGGILERRLDLVLRSVRPERQAMSAQYLQWVLALNPLPLDRVRPVLDEAVRAGQQDIALQLIDQFRNEDVSPLRERLVERFDDPWSRVRLAAARGRLRGLEGKPGEAERVLRSTLDRCQPESLVVSCFYVREELADLYLAVGRVADARRVLADTAARLGAAGVHPQERKALLSLAELTVRSGEVALARATFEDLQLREPQRCLSWEWARELLAQGYVREREASRARAVMREAPGCTLDPEPWRAEWRLDLGRLEKDPAMLREARALAASGVSFADASRSDRQQARMLEAEADLALGAPGAEKTLAERVDAVGDSDSVAVRSTVARERIALSLAAVGRGDGSAALDQISRLYASPALRTCAAGVVSDVTHSGWVTVGADGKAQVGIDDVDGPPKLPATEVDRLRDCNGPIAVLVAGDRAAQISLPDSLSWAFRVGPIAEPGALGKDRLLVRDVNPPPDLQLAPLRSPRLADGGWSVLAGGEATPGRVLARLRDADVVDFEVHGIVDAKVPDGAVLVLSEDPERNYALSATELQTVQLSRRPVIFLGACRAATGSRLRAEPWSLPTTLVRSGARAVYASLHDLPDHEVGEFFRRVTTRLDSGEAPAVALRNERVEWVKAGKPWVRDVVLFD
jgi:predicted Zn-dependent protease